MLGAFSAPNLHARSVVFGRLAVLVTVGNFSDMDTASASAVELVLEKAHLQSARFDLLLHHWLTVSLYLVLGVREELWNDGSETYPGPCRIIRFCCAV